MEDQEGELQLWKSDSPPQSMVSVTVGRVMDTLLGARPKKLQDAVSRLSPDRSHGASSLGSSPILQPFLFQFVLLNCISSTDSLDQSLWFLHKYVGDAAQNHASLDEILVPMIEHVFTHLSSFSMFASKSCEFVCEHFKHNRADVEIQG